MGLGANQTNRDFTGLTDLLMRRIAKGEITAATIEEIAQRAADSQMSGKPTVDITSLSADGSSATGELVMSSNDVLVVCMNILKVIDPMDITAPRKLFTRTDFSRNRGPFDYNSQTWP
jgi:hypothetical protein